jgi:hypothetical protein
MINQNTEKFASLRSFYAKGGGNGNQLHFLLLYNCS